MAKARKYFSLLTRDGNSDWSVAFGDYDREVVEQERNDYADAGSYRVRDMRIIVTGDKQSDVNDKVDAINKDWRNN